MKTTVLTISLILSGFFAFSQENKKVELKDLGAGTPNYNSNAAGKTYPKPADKPSFKESSTYKSTNEAYKSVGSPTPITKNPVTGGKAVGGSVTKEY